jgi:hypothetical protein
MRAMRAMRAMRVKEARMEAREVRRAARRRVRAGKGSEEQEDPADWEDRQEMVEPRRVEERAGSRWREREECRGLARAGTREREGSREAEWAGPVRVAWAASEEPGWEEPG